jgi:predicted RNase H-like HicB family nuclease
MRTYATLIERCLESGMLVGSVPELQGAYRQAVSLDKLLAYLREVIELIEGRGRLAPQRNSSAST